MGRSGLWVASTCIYWKPGYQRQWADANYPGGVVRMLDDIGLLSPRLTLAHCVWARPEELELLAERGVDDLRQHQFQSSPSLRHRARLTRMMERRLLGGVWNRRQSSR